MILNYLLFHFLLFFLGLFGIIFNQFNLIILLMSIELVLLSINLNFLFFSVIHDDIIGQIYSLYILTVAAAESAIGLAIIIVFYRLKGSIKMFFIGYLSK